ncbi:HupE/UreJ family protein, partial [Myxococcus sp. AM009]|nr:HupE/UreJ family protein [Myxococcus sp. AM009]
MTWVSPRAMLACLLLAAGAAAAHDADIIYIEAHRAGPEAPEVRQLLTMTPRTLAMLLADADGGSLLTRAALDARRDAIAASVWDAMPLASGGLPCARTAHAAAPRQSFVELSATFTCPPGGMRQRFQVLARLPPEYRVILGSVREGEVPGAVFAEAGRPEVDVPE